MAQAKVTYEVRAYTSDGKSHKAFHTGDIVEHQAAIADNRDFNKAVRIRTPVAILGANAEYATLTTKNNSGAALTAAGTAGIDITLIKNVPDWVQYGLYGQFSPWQHPPQKVKDNDLLGIIEEDHTVTTLSVTLSSARQTNTSTATLADATEEDRIKITPLTNEVVMFNKGGIIMHAYTGYTIA